ncbi:hypothetical protein GUJ93_ZPchr0002g26257 [Zizania palustris]|uniref:Uncharacterized protein n=1 Tax=Zizania palustris TaxID=103762 RepID=A0A8J5VQM4_ZIZPA|nr:hypothetical protein GUJ93_ZPchr0002g26257 [Zizania palustris]
MGMYKLRHYLAASGEADADVVAAERIADHGPSPIGTQPYPTLREADAHRRRLPLLRILRGPQPTHLPIQGSDCS